MRSLVKLDTDAGEVYIEFLTDNTDSPVGDAVRVLSANLLDLINSGMYDESEITVSDSAATIGTDVIAAPGSPFCTLNAATGAIEEAEEPVYRDDSGAPALPAGVSLDAFTLKNDAFTVSYAVPSNKAPAQFSINLAANAALDTGSRRGVVVGVVVRGRSVLEGAKGSKLRISAGSIVSTSIPNPIVDFETSLGTFSAELYNDKMPLVVGNIVDLVKGKFYDGLHIHRVIKDFVMQFGCPNTKDPKARTAGQGGPKGGSTFQTLAEEPVTQKRDSAGKISDEHTFELTNSKLTLSMANSGPNTCGSQFFVNLKDNAQLDWFNTATKMQHPVFGRIVAGADVVAAIGAVKTGKNDAPAAPIQVKAAKLR